MWSACCGNITKLSGHKKVVREGIYLKKLSWVNYTMTWKKKKKDKLQQNQAYKHYDL